MRGALRLLGLVLFPIWGCTIYPDFVYEPNGMLHGKTTALEYTEYLFFCDGPVLFYDDNGFTTYLGWEELERMRDEHEANKVSAG